MAKKATVELSQDDLIGQVKKEISSVYKTDNIISSGDELIHKNVEIISTGSPLLDDALGGGIPGGCFVGISGDPKLGKTTLLLSSAKEAQKQGRLVVYIDAEHRLKRMNLVSCKGLDMSGDKFVHVHSTKEKVLSAQDFLNIAIMYLKTVPRVFMIIDSVSCLVDERIVEGGLGTETRGSGAKLLSGFVDQVGAIVPIQDSNVCSVSHIISDTSGKSMTGKMEKNARRLIYQADIRIKATHVTPWKVAEKEIGGQIHWNIQCSALGTPPNTKVDSWHRYGMGIDAVYEIYEIAKTIDLITGDGAWKQLAYLEKYPNLLDEDKKIPNIQGGDKVYQLLSERTDWFDALKKEIREFLHPEKK